MEHLPKTMPAVICHEPEDCRLEERPVPVPQAGEVVIRVNSTGICASDIKCYSGAALFWGDDNRQGYCQAPVIRIPTKHCLKSCGLSFVPVGIRSFSYALCANCFLQESIGMGITPGHEFVGERSGSRSST